MSSLARLLPRPMPRSILNGPRRGWGKYLCGPKAGSLAARFEGGGQQTELRRTVSLPWGKVSILSIYTDAEGKLLPQDLREGLMLIDRLASLDQARQVASQLERTSITRTKMPSGQAGRAELHVIAARCTDMVEAVAPDLFHFQSKRARQQGDNIRPSFHFYGPKGEHTYDLRLCTRFPHPDEPQLSMITFKDSRTSMTYPIKIQPGQTYAIPAEIGLKKFQPNAVWRHSVSDLDSGLTWVVDFKYS